MPYSPYKDKGMKPRKVNKKESGISNALEEEELFDDIGPLPSNKED